MTSSGARESGALAAEIAESSPKVRLTWQWSHTAGPDALDVGNYASEGLAMFFDGYRNAGRAAPHDPAATAWANLAGTGNNAPLTVNDAESKWLENGYFFGGGTYGQLAVQQYLGSNYTVQIACDVDTREQFAIRAANGKALGWPHLFGAGNEPNGAYRPAAYTFTAPTATLTVGDKDYQLDGYVVET